MVMASISASTGGPSASDSSLTHLGGIEALKLKVGPVRRNLFGPVDHEQLQQDFQRLLHMTVEVASKRWGFDFQEDRPGEGADMEWVELECKDVPKFYRSRVVRPVVRKTKGPRRMSSSSSSSSSSGEGSPISSSSSGSGDEYLEVTTRGRYSIQRLEKRKQAAITDFFKVKKRRLLHYKMSSRQ
uniref:Cyclin-dependent kinase inhibitor domain-containing protein n=1 Tax=Nothobranchius kadleci TaxID=1051664 RepID=A0A1A8BHB8_NOTKA